MSKFVTKTEGQLNSARSSILLIVLLSIVNIFAIAFLGTYYVFSAYLPQVFISFAVYVEPALFTGMFILSLLYILPYLLCYIFSKKKVGWMIAALVLFSVDSLFFLIDFPAYLEAEAFSMFIDLAIRVYVLITLIMGVVYGLKQKKEGANAVTTQEAPTIANAPYADEETRQITITRKKGFIGCAIAFIVYANRQEVGRLKNGETKTFTMPANPFELSLSYTTGIATESIQVPAGTHSLAYEASVKMTVTASRIVINPVNR